MKLYALYHKPSKSFLEVDVVSNGDAEFCNAYSCCLTTWGGDSIWVATSVEQVERVLCNDIGWYNSSLYTPECKYKREDLEIVEFISKEKN